MTTITPLEHAEPERRGRFGIRGARWANILPGIAGTAFAAVLSTRSFQPHELVFSLPNSVSPLHKLKKPICARKPFGTQ
jgi:hypothetical protein